ncbi:exopolyphosphatase [Daejeonella sp.]|uniref:Ppx/GppA phosphatase family protein n=1 Tax=Daejeonella sp. TaxID=2805397 RepID=UPI0039830C11
MIDSAYSNQLTTNNQPTRVAILDLGTNTFHLLIADVEAGGKPKIVYEETIAVKLGDGSIAQGTISQGAFGRGIKALTIFKKHIDEFQAVSVRSVATSAIRSASNANEFIKKIEEETGIIVQIIDGEREAELIYFGVRAAVIMNETSLIVDIGGGSVEFIICDTSTLFWKKSYPIGAARLMEKFHIKDPISQKSISELYAYLDNSLKDLHNHLAHYKPRWMIGSAGSFETFAKLQDADFKVSFDRPEQEIDLGIFSKISHQIIKSTHAERALMTAIPAVRVDMIVVSTIMASYIIHRSGISVLKLSTYSLKEGLLFEMGK